MKEENVFLEELRKELLQFTDEVFTDNELTMSLSTLDKEAMWFLDDRLIKKMSWSRMENKRHEPGTMIHARYRKMLRNLCATCIYIKNVGCDVNKIKELLERRPDIYSLLNMKERNFTYREKVKLIKTDTRKIISYPDSDTRETIDEFMKRFFGTYDNIGVKEVDFIFKTYFC